MTRCDLSGRVCVVAALAVVVSHESHQSRAGR